MKTGLRLPESFKFIKIVLAIENYILRGEMRIFIKMAHKILSHSLVCEHKFLTAIAYFAEVSA